MGGFEGLHLSNFKVPSNWGVMGGLNIQIDNFVIIIIQNFNYNLQDKLQSMSECIDFKGSFGAHDRIDI